MGIVAIMRLAIDPFPILLMDEEILYRCFDSITDPYSEKFVDTYIGETIVDEYKKTRFYYETKDLEYCLESNIYFSYRIYGYRITRYKW